MQTLIITPPKGWQSPRAAQMLVEHVVHHGGTLTLAVKDNVVTRGTLTMPNEPPAHYNTERVQGIRAQIVRLRQLVREYGWQTVTPEEEEQSGGLQAT